MDEKELEALKTANPKAYEFIVGQKAELEKSKAELEKRKTKSDPDPDDQDDDGEDDLASKAKADREAKDKGKAREKSLESALRFTMNSKDFLKQNEALLPKDMADIFSAAEKETYDDAIQKDAAIKAGLVKSFFQVQANVDLLTQGQKSMLDDYLKLTNTGRQEKAQYIYDMIFEPAFDTLKRVKKAEAVKRGESGHGDGDDEAYKQRLMKMGRKKFMGERENAQ